MSSRITGDISRKEYATAFVTAWLCFMIIAVTLMTVINFVAAMVIGYIVKWIIIISLLSYFHEPEDL